MSEVQVATESKLVFSQDGVYDRLKKIALIALPALGTLYFTIAGIWGLPYAEQVVGTVAAVDLFLGVLVTASKKAYNASNAGFDGSFEVFEDEEGGKQLVLALDEDPQTLLERSEVSFRVTDDV